MEKEKAYFVIPIQKWNATCIPDFSAFDAMENIPSGVIGIYNSISQAKVVAKNLTKTYSIPFAVVEYKIGYTTERVAKTLTFGE